MTEPAEAPANAAPAAPSAPAKPAAAPKPAAKRAHLVILKAHQLADGSWLAKGDVVSAPGKLVAQLLPKSKSKAALARATARRAAPADLLLANALVKHLAD